MDLILWRHAEAYEAKPGERDLDRALTAKGERQAERMARWLNHRIADSTRVLASPARRTQQTAEALGRKFETVEALAPDASVDAVLQAARWPDARKPVLVVGHQPTLGLVAAHLLGTPGEGFVFRKGAVWWLRAREREGAGQVVLVGVQNPEFL